MNSLYTLWNIDIFKTVVFFHQSKWSLPAIHHQRKIMPSSVLRLKRAWNVHRKKCIKCNYTEHHPFILRWIFSQWKSSSIATSLKVKKNEIFPLREDDYFEVKFSGILKLLWKMSSNFVNQNLVLLVIVACKFGFEFELWPNKRSSIFLPNGRFCWYYIELLLYSFHSVRFIWRTVVCFMRWWMLWCMWHTLFSVCFVCVSI